MKLISTNTTIKLGSLIIVENLTKKEYTSRGKIKLEPDQYFYVWVKEDGDAFPLMFTVPMLKRILHTTKFNTEDIKEGFFSKLLDHDRGNLNIIENKDKKPDEPDTFYCVKIFNGEEDAKLILTKRAYITAKGLAKNKPELIQPRSVLSDILDGLG